MKNNERSSTNQEKSVRSAKQGGDMIPTLLRICGTLVFISIIAICIPMVLPRFTDINVYNIVSGSMEPEIPVGSFVLTIPEPPENVQDGAVIAFIGGQAPSAIPDQNQFDETNQDGMNQNQGIGQDQIIQSATEGQDHSVVTHRVVHNRFVEGEFITKGDANPQEDLNPIPYSAYLGTMKLHLPYVGGLMEYGTTRTGRIYMILYAACGVLFHIVAFRIEKPRKKRGASRG